jgi:hypothetical protein
MEDTGELTVRITEKERKYWDSLFSDAECPVCHNAPPKAKRKLKPHEDIYPGDMELCGTCGKFYIWGKDRKIVVRIFVPLSEEGWLKVWPI